MDLKWLSEFWACWSRSNRCTRNNHARRRTKDATGQTVPARTRSDRQSLVNVTGSYRPLQTLNCSETGRLIVETKPFGLSTAPLQATDALWVFGLPPHGNAMKVTQGSQTG